MVILDSNGMTFDAVGIFGLAFQLYLNLAHHTVGCPLTPWLLRPCSDSPLSLHTAEP
jgi:hypothetical protein